MKKDEFIRRYGLEAYYRKLEQDKEWYQNHKEERLEYSKEWNKNNQDRKKENDKKWRKNNPEYHKEWRENNPEAYEGKLEYHKEWRKNNRERNNAWRRNYSGGQADHNSIPYKKEQIRQRDHRKYNPIKQFFSKIDTEIHHQWIKGTADYSFIALVERSKHRYNIIDPIVILEGRVELREETDKDKGGE